MGNINISTATAKAYAKEQRTMTNEGYSKQTQSNPIRPPAGRKYEIQTHLHAGRVANARNYGLLRRYSYIL